MTATKSRTKAVVLMTFLVFAGVVTGFFLGIIVANGVAKKKEKPAFWKEAAHKQLERLRPTAEQRTKFDARTDVAVQELVKVKHDTIQQVWEIVEGAVGDIDKELTPEQREVFGKIKPKKPAELK